jgi:hypothetical protein
LLCQQKDATIAQVRTNVHSVTFSRWLVDRWKEEWEKILYDIAKIQLIAETDSISWKFGGAWVILC